MVTKLRYSRWGLGQHFGDHILLNQGLLKPKWHRLHGQIILHELRHDKGDNLKNDLLEYISLREYLQFCREHPGALAQISPIWVYGGRLEYDSYQILFILACILWFIISFRIL